MANLIFNYGTMNSKKTLDLLAMAHDYTQKGKDVIIIKPLVDVKAENKISSRIGIEKECNFLIKKNENIEELLKTLLTEKKIDILFVDEVQFLDEEQIESLFKISKGYNVIVYGYGLATNYKGKFFKGSARLFELADELNFFKSICHCGKHAKFNIRKIDGKLDLDGTEIMIDGQTKNMEYITVCSDCYYNLLYKGEK